MRLKTGIFQALRGLARGWILVFFLLALSDAALAVSPQNPAPGTGNINGEGVSAQALYFRWCSQCHGLGGRGDGINSTEDMTIDPSDHTDPGFMSTRTDEQFEELIREGGGALAKSPLMPPWKETLTNAEIKSLVKYMRLLCRCEFEGVVSHRKLRRVAPEFR